MTVAHAITALFWAGALTLGLGLWRRSRLWMAGRPSDFSWAQLATIPKRYFVDLHHVVARDPYIARTHIAVAGGAVAALVLTALNYGLAIYSRTLDFAIVAAAAVMLTGAVFVWLRRTNKPARLSGGAWDRLPYTLVAFALGLLLLMWAGPERTSQLIAAAALALLLIGAAELALGIGTGGPMKHAVAGLLHLAFHPRPQRFAGERSTALKPLALSSKDYGALKPADFLWNQLLGFDACVQCGKCEAACPAFAAGQPLNPKKLIQDLVAGFSSDSDRPYAGSPTPSIAVGSHSGAPQLRIVPGLIEPETLWACTTCRACVEECPMLIEHVDAIVGMRRGLTLNEGSAPGKASETLANLRDTGTQTNSDNTRRFAWALDLGIPIATPSKQVDVLLYAGESAFDPRAQRTLRALIKVLKAAGVDFALQGEAERDTGDIARRLGDEATFETLARRNIAHLKTLSFNTIVTADPHVLHSLKNEYPAVGAHFDVLHHSTYLAQLIEQGRIKTRTRSEVRAVTYHDPCYLGRYNGEFDAPRSVLKALGVPVREMERSKSRSRCCGGGGGAPLTDIPGERRIPDMRMKDVQETGAQVVAVACPQCTAMLEGVTQDTVEVLDIAELVADALEPAA